LVVASALVGLQNATVTFTVPAAGTVVDAETGNVVANTTTVQVGAFLKGESVAETTYPGVNVITTLFEGYVTSGALDAGVKVGTSGSLVFAGQDATDCEVLEVRLPYGETGVLGSVLTSALGAKIRLASRNQS
jgi:hypothetical protein